jgi:hypothetical protein
MTDTERHSHSTLLHLLLRHAQQIVGEGQSARLNGFRQSYTLPYVLPQKSNRSDNCPKEHTTSGAGKRVLSLPLHSEFRARLPDSPTPLNTPGALKKALRSADNDYLKQTLA